jgi:hypothetical protein
MAVGIVAAAAGDRDRCWRFKHSVEPEERRFFIS